MNFDRAQRARLLFCRPNECQRPSGWPCRALLSRCRLRERDIIADTVTVQLLLLATEERTDWRWRAVAAAASLPAPFTLVQVAEALGLPEPVFASECPIVDESSMERRRQAEQFKEVSQALFSLKMRQRGEVPVFWVEADDGKGLEMIR